MKACAITRTGTVLNATVSRFIRGPADSGGAAGDVRHNNIPDHGRRRVIDKRDRGARGRNEQETGEDNEPPSHVRILTRESRAPLGASRIRLEPQDESGAEASGKTRAAENGTMILVSASTSSVMSRVRCVPPTGHLVAAS